MLKFFVKNMLFVLLLLITGNRFVSADVRNYQYDGGMPFVQMMLEMMTTMGMLDRVPVNGIYNRHGRSRYLNSPWSRSYLNANRWNNWNDNRWNGNRWNSNSWNDGGWGDNGLGGTSWSDKWGDPTWGVLPPESYALSDWVGEPWEDSSWNSQRQMEQKNNSFSEDDINPSNQSPLARLVQPEQPATPISKELRQKPCVTSFCGLKKPNLNGLWVSETGEMLGIKDNRYLWSDGESRYLTGWIKVQNEHLLASIEEHPQLMRFKYKHSGDYLSTMDANGVIREFVRMSVAQYYDFTQGYGQNFYRGYN